MKSEDYVGLTVIALILYRLWARWIYKGAYEDGHKAGCAFAFDEGYMKGFEVGHISAEQWWADAEVAVQTEREKIWREE